MRIVQRGYGNPAAGATQEQLEAALDRQEAYGGRLGEVLLHYGFVNEDVLVRAVSKLTGIQRADLSGEPDPFALGRVPRDVAPLLYTAALRTRLDEAGRGLEAHLKTIALQAQQVDALDQLAARVDDFNHEFGGLVGRLQVEDLELGLGRLQKKGDLPAQAKARLAEFEKNAAELRSMGAQLKQLQEYLGAPTQVKRGDSHSKLALDYLTQRAGLTPQQAEAVVRQTALAWEIEPGNQVIQPLSRRHPAHHGDPGHRGAPAAGGAVVPAPGPAEPGAGAGDEAARVRGEGPGAPVTTAAAPPRTPAPRTA